MTTTSAAVPVTPARRTEPEWVVVVVVVVALVAGWLLKTTVEGSTIRYASPEISLSYPASWLRDIDPEPGTLFSASNMRSGSLYSSNVAVRVSDALPTLPAGPEAGDIEKLTPAITAWSFQRGQELSGFRVLGTESADLGGRQSAMIRYAFVSDPISSPFRKALPVVVEAADYLVPLGDKVIIVTVAADGMRFEGEDSRWFQPILSSVAFAHG
jgi:hypothetical protein